MENNELKKEIGLLAASAVVIGMVIGSGVFFKPTAIYTATGAPGLGMIAWVIGGFITIAGGLTAAEVAAAACLISIVAFDTKPLATSACDRFRSATAC